MKKKLITFFIGIITIGAIGVFVYTLVHSVFYFPEEEIPLEELPEAIQQSVVSHDVTKPIQLQIPSLEIDAKIQEVGIAKNGAMAAPNNFTDVGWYKYGTAPGDIGSAVIDGHVDNGLALAGVFKNLDKLVIGDDVFVVDEEGNRLHFKVEDIQIYNHTEAPEEIIFNQQDTRRLNLITCKGNWLKEIKTYDKRLVVYTTYVSSNDTAPLE